MSKHGSFSEDNPKTEWIVEDGIDRDMTLIDHFWYVDPNEKKWYAPAKSRIDGATIPRPLWSMVGSPYTDNYRRASIVHDIACQDPTVPRKDVDVMFYHACLAGGCSFFQANVLYAGVRIGAWADQIISPESFSRETMLFQFPLSPSADEKYVQNKFQEIVLELKSMRDEISITELDELIGKHIRL